MTAETEIIMRKGEAVNLLITPRLFVYKGREGITLEADGDSIPAVMSLYADILYLAALNWWELEGNALDGFRHRRVDFHAWAAEHPEEFASLVRLAVRLLSGKSLAEQVREQKERDGADVKKKSSCGWITTLWRRSWSAIAAGRRRRRAGRR